MTAPPDIDWLASLVEAQYGLVPSSTQCDNLAAWLGTGRTKRKVGSERVAVLRELVEQLVVGETYFFREAAQIEHCVRRVLPELATTKVSSRRLRILSAGCSTGEEAYSLAIAADARAGGSGEDVSIVGVDVSGTAIKKAERGRYSAWSLRSTPVDIRNNCFRKCGDEFNIEERYGTRVRFEERNLFDPDPDFWLLGAFDIIFCRNVTIYFSLRAVKDLMKRFASVLPAGGFLFLGHSETLRGISNDFEVVHHDGVFCYRRIGLSRSFSSIFHAVSPTVPLVPSPVIPTVPSVPQRPVTSPREWNREKVMSLFEVERFDEALAMLDDAPAGAENELYRAVVSSAKGRFRDVESTCRMLLADRQFEPEAHYLLALCCSQERTFDAAEKHYREATRLDPDFSMPRLQLGLLLDRSGDRARARIELDAATRLLPDERRNRVVLFGGGFSREALVKVCRTRLEQIGTIQSRRGSEDTRRVLE